MATKTMPWDIDSWTQGLVSKFVKSNTRRPIGAAIEILPVPSHQTFEDNMVSPVKASSITE